MSQADPNPNYWSQYSNLQQVKHDLIKHYLDGWLPKLTIGQFRCPRLLYIDTHAGRGMYQNGRLGSPLVALTTLLKHTSRNRILSGTQVYFHFIERDQDNLAALQGELAAHPQIANVFTEAETGDGFEIIQNAIAGVERDSGCMPPSFVFVDPYGFKLPGSLLRQLLQYPRVELFVNVIWRELDMAMQLVRGDCTPATAEAEDGLFKDPVDLEELARKAQRQADVRASLEPTLNRVFDGDCWRQINAAHPDDRADQCAAMFRQVTAARWGTHLRMLDNNRVRYFLLHLTNHDAGRDLMKGCMWKACPQGGFYASKSDHPDQKMYIEPEPDLRPLEAWVTKKLAAGPKRWQTLVDELREEWWLSKHLNEVVRSMRKDRRIVADSYSGPFALTNNPRLALAGQPQSV
jgi:three-Cys-motif partner protein